MSRRNKWVLALMFLLGIAIFTYSLRDIKFSVLVSDFVHINFGDLALPSLYGDVFRIRSVDC